MQLKSFIKKMAVEKKLSAQLVMQNYMLERLLERISLSRYRQNFVFKGGFLIASMVGLDNRATKDLDATMQGITLTHDIIRTIFDELCTMEIDDDVSFSISKIFDIRIMDTYPGIRINLKAYYPPLCVHLAVDVTTGDRITPKEIEYSFKLFFHNRAISILAYNLETILAEKIETILSRNTANTRLRDFYDVNILYALRGKEVRFEVLKSALLETTKRRGSGKVLAQYREIMSSIKSSKEMNVFWMNHQKDFAYAKDITFEATCDSLLSLMCSTMDE
jgi:predicted nucleotidyltransferase component of viral defense system